jgi:hypothetical protein
MTLQHPELEADRLDQTATQYLEMMDRFRAAYVAIDAEGLQSLVTANFEWHIDWFPVDAPVHTGKVLRGIGEMVAELERRKAAWSEVRFRHLKEQFQPGLVVQTFVISGVDQSTGPFEVSAVDLYTVTDQGLISKKDTYWKRGRADWPR